MNEKEVDRPGEPGGAGTDSVTLAGPPGAKAAGDWALSPSQWNSVPSWKKVALETWRKSGDDHIGLIAAGVAFYGFLAFVPLLAAIVLLYGLLADASTVVHDVQRMTSIMPPAAANLVGDQLMQLVKTSDGKKGLGVLTALVIAMFGTVNCAGSIVTALNVACEVKETRGFIALYGLALGIATAAVLTAIGALILVAALVQVEEFLPGVSAAPLFLGKLIAYLALTLVGAAVATTLYRFGPSLGEENLGKADPRTWVWFTPGSVLASVSWLALTSGFGTYAAKIGHYNATYGSLSAVIIMLTWMYLSSYVLLFGAELNAELARKT